jgi:hypothetical protein
MTPRRAMGDGVTAPEPPASVVVQALVLPTRAPRTLRRRFLHRGGSYEGGEHDLRVPACCRPEAGAPQSGACRAEERGPGAWRGHGRCSPPQAL